MSRKKGEPRPGAGAGSRRDARPRCRRRAKAHAHQGRRQRPCRARRRRLHRRPRPPLPDRRPGPPRRPLASPQVVRPRRMRHRLLRLVSIWRPTVMTRPPPVSTSRAEGRRDGSPAFSCPAQIGHEAALHPPGPAGKMHAWPYRSLSATFPTESATPSPAKPVTSESRCRSTCWRNSSASPNGRAPLNGWRGCGGARPRRTPGCDGLRS